MALTPCGLAYQNWIDLPGITFSAGSTAQPQSAGQVASPHVYWDFWQSLNTTSSWIGVDFKQPLTIGVLAAIGILATASDTARWRLSNQGVGGAEVYDSGFYPCGVKPGYDLAVLVPPTDLVARYLRLDVDAPSQAARNAVRVGRLWAGPLFKPSRQRQYGWSDDWADASTVTVAPWSGSEHVDERPSRRVLSFSLDYLNKADSDELKELGRVAGTRRQVLFIPVVGGADTPTEAILGRMKETTPIIQPRPRTYSKSFTINQSL